MKLLLGIIIFVALQFNELSMASQNAGGDLSPTFDGAQIALRDNAFLTADIFLPSAEGKFPTILVITPYNRKLMGAALPDPELKGHLFFDRQKYAMVIVDWRGFFGSRKAASKKAKPGEDGYDVVEWIASQSWSNGKVGMWGPSALGKIQFYTAIENPPHLVCAVPMVCQFGYSYGQFFHGGVLKKSYTDTVAGVGFNLRRIMVHPVKDRFWDAVEKKKETGKINIPMLLISGWYDLFTEGVLATFDDLSRNGGSRAKKNVKLLMGPWDHSNTGKNQQGDLKFPNAEGYDISQAKRFFDYWLLGEKDNHWPDTPVIQYYELGSNSWKESNKWPKAPREKHTYYLVENGVLRDKATGSSSESKKCYTYNPDDPSPTIGGMTVSKFWDPSAPQVTSGPRDQRPVIQDRKDFLLFTNEKLREKVTVKGAPEVKLYVSSDRIDTDFAVRLCDVTPDGKYILVSDGIQRARFRESKRKAEYMKVGNVYEMTITLSMTAYTFLEGHQISLIITSSNYPRFDVNKNLDRRRLFKSNRTFLAENCIHTGLGELSSLTLPNF